MADRYYYVGPWVWDRGGFWRAPDGTLGSIDLRSLPDCAATVTPRGYGLFVTDRQLDSDYALAGMQLDDAIGPKARSTWASRLGLAETPTGPNLLQVMIQTLGMGADPTGDTLCPPLMPTHRGRLEFCLGGLGDDSRVWSKRFVGVDDPFWPKMRERLARDYTAIKQSVEGRTGKAATLHRRWLSAMASKLKVPWELIGDEAPERPETTISEGFNTSDGATLGPDLTWSELQGDWTISSNLARSENNASNVARADHDLSSDDHYAQVDLLVLATSNAAGPICRKDGTATLTFYHYRLFDPSTSQLYKAIAGTLTQLGSNTGVTVSLPDTLRVTSDGSSIVGAYNGVDTITQTDTAITGNLRCGMRAFQSQGYRKNALDNFVAADLAAPPASMVPAAMYHRRQQCS